MAADKTVSAAFDLPRQADSNNQYNNEMFRCSFIGLTFTQYRNNVGLTKEIISFVDNFFASRSFVRIKIVSSLYLSCSLKTTIQLLLLYLLG